MRKSLSFLTMATIFEQVKKVAGSRTVSNERFTTARSLLLLGATFCMGWPSLDK